MHLQTFLFPMLVNQELLWTKVGPLGGLRILGAEVLLICLRYAKQVRLYQGLRVLHPGKLPAWNA